MDDIYRYYVTEDCNDELLLKYWNEVCQNIKNLSFVQKSEWFNAYLKSDLDSSFYSCFIVFLRDGKPVAVFPLQYRITSRFGFSLKTWWILSPRELCLNDLVNSPAEQNQNIIGHLIKYLIIYQPLVLKSGGHLNDQNRTEYIGRVISLELWLRRQLSN